MLLISYHILYTFLYIYFSFSFMSMPANTTEVDTGENCMYPKVLSLFSICMYPNVLSLYETMISICPKQGRYSDPNGIYVIDPNEASISVSICCNNVSL